MSGVIPSDPDDDARRAEQFGIAFRAEQARNFGCAGEIECCFPMSGNCHCFNTVLAAAIAKATGEPQ